MEHHFANVARYSLSVAEDAPKIDWNLLENQLRVSIITQKNKKKT